MKLLTNRMWLPFRIGAFATALLVAAMLVAAMLDQSPPSLAFDGILTDCRVRGVIAGGPSPNPAIFSDREVIVTQLSAEFDQPKAATECMITGPTWSWTIKKVERWASQSAGWQPHSYRPPLQQPNPNAPDARLRATFPQPGSWRVTLEVTASWSSSNCIGCSPTGTVVVEATVSPCSFAGVLTPDDNFMGRSYSRVGLAERGSLAVRVAAGGDLATLTPLKWRVKSGSEFITVTDSGAGDGTATFQAKTSPGRAVLEVMTTTTTCRATMTIDIVAPNQVYLEYVKDDPRSGIVAGLVGYGFEAKVFLKPTDVSFISLTTGEGTCPVSECTGAFVALGTGPHPANGPITMLGGDLAKGTCMNGDDDVFSGDVAVDGAAGRFVWIIPQQYFSEGYRINIPNGDLSHISTFDGIRTIRMQKDGVDRSGPP